MVTLFIIALLTIELVTSTDGNIYSENRGLKFKSSYVDFRPASDLVHSMDCDPVGTLVRSSLRCTCRPRFYGLRCERIFRCVSGRPRNISCISSEDQHIFQSDQRCLFAVVDFLEVCECFEGYTGPLCEKKARRPQLRFSPEFISPIQESGHKSRPPSDSESSTEEEEERILSATGSNQWIAAFLLMHVLLVLIAAVSVSLALVCYLGRRNARKADRAAAQRSMVSDKVPNLENEAFLFPPDYEEATNNEPKIALSKDCEQSEIRGATFVGQKNASLVVTDVNKQLHLHV